MEVDERCGTEPRIRYSISRDGVSIAFWTRGHGQPLVYMAGGPWSHVESWYVPECRGWYERLARNRMLVRYDVRGTGWSERNVSDHSLDALAADLESVVDRLGLDKFDLLAAADAGPAAVAFASRHPERVARLVLWCSWIRAADVLSRGMDAWCEAWLRLAERHWASAAEACAHRALGWSAGEVGRQSARSLRESVTPGVARAAMGALGTFDVTDLLPGLRVPTLVLSRRDIPWLPVGIAQEIASRIPDARLIVLEGESTAPYIGNSESVASAIETFLAEAERELAFTRSAGAGAAPGDGHVVSGTPLTPRELEVLRILASGGTNAEIAEQLVLSVRTVERHAANIYAKLGARGRADATAYALTLRLI
jgi:pimeloyl-ACP methyl ester carboxylesterase/DNA-binding CsgD family transcriptional regulator